MHFGTAFLLFQRVERADAEPTPWVGQLFDVGFFAHRSVSIDLSIQTNGTQIPVSAGASLHLRLAGAQPFVGARFVVLFDLQEVGGAGLVSYGPALLAGFDFVPADRVGLFLQASVALIRLPGSVTAFEPDPTLLSISPIAGGLLLRF
jgi:hypothetical protein